METLWNTDWDLSVFQPYTIDCSNCCGLCCVALYFSKIDGFPKDKQAGIACNNLEQDYKCKIHGTLAEQGLKGCMAYDCFGAGQYITSCLSEMPNWQTISDKDAKIIFDSFLALMQMHQVLWYLTVASTLDLEEAEKAKIRLLLHQGKAQINQPLTMLQTVDFTKFRDEANQILKKICFDFANKFSNHNKLDEHKNYIGKNFKQKNLVGKDFSMSLLIAANLEQANLFAANFLGADMRDTNIKNTNLCNCLFLTQIQLNAAQGNANTILPPYLNKPVSWNS